MAAGNDNARQIAEVEQAFRDREAELKDLNERIKRLQQKRDREEALTEREEADFTKWEARRDRVQQSSDLLTQLLRELAAAQGESYYLCWLIIADL